ncbi:hypothetical protein [Flavobacterium sp. KACC 22761]|uniref:hypothetical protein n=1 Tax=Flavobacterium sp. KACC 22761 TaxID=3092665 RepID=UPI002A748B77|nr:hypothetical protein [Flavobacterium sp. KACC 22761]WPO80160.1 hypothetical protein SCB73_07195 [Flavobacterium sp. KACC 22761]
MRSLKNLDIEKSIEKSKLVYTESWFEIIDTILLLMFFSFGFICPFLVYFDPHRDHSNTGGEYYLLFFMSFFFAYAIYRKLTEKHLTKIISKYDLEKNRTIIIEYCKKFGFQKAVSSKKLVIYNKSDNLAINNLYQSSRIFILDKNDIYITMIKEGHKTNFPVLISQIILKWDIKKLCQ